MSTCEKGDRIFSLNPAMIVKLLLLSHYEMLDWTRSGETNC